VKEAVRLFSGAFEQTNALKVIDGFVVNCLTRELMSAEVTAVLEKLERLSKAVLSGHGGQFKGQWKEWRRERRV
jgi:hypothetical protein